MSKLRELNSVLIAQVKTLKVVQTENDSLAKACGFFGESSKRCNFNSPPPSAPRRLVKRFPRRRSPTCANSTRASFSAWLR